MRQRLVGTAIATLFTACGQPTDLSDASRLEGVEQTAFDLIAALSEQAATIEELGMVASAPFEVQARLLRVDGHVVWAFEYADHEAASHEASRFSADATQYRTTSEASMITWVGAPHLFLRERWIAAYVGSDLALLALLSVVMGQQFAGALS